MSLENDERWVRVLEAINLLSMNGFTGSIRINMVDGRVRRSTMSHLYNLIARYLTDTSHKVTQRKEAIHG